MLHPGKTGYIRRSTWIPSHMISIYCIQKVGNTSYVTQYRQIVFMFLWWQLRVNWLEGTWWNWGALPGNGGYQSSRCIRTLHMEYWPNLGFLLHSQNMPVKRGKRGHILGDKSGKRYKLLVRKSTLWLRSLACALHNVLHGQSNPWFLSQRGSSSFTLLPLPEFRFLS